MLSGELEDNIVKLSAVPRDYRGLYRAALAQGWTVEIAGKRNPHLRWTTPDGKDVFTPGTPSVNGTGLIRIVSKLRRAGLEYGKN